MGSESQKQDGNVMMKLNLEDSLVRLLWCLNLNSISRTHGFFFHFLKPGMVVVAPTCNPRTGKEETGVLLAGWLA